jgi:arylsulfatase A
VNLNRRKWLACTGAAALHGAAARKPNVILIMSDDQGYGDFSCHGNPHVKTPVLDGLASDGVEFTRFYVSPVCAPTRASLLTGRYNLRCGVHGVTRGFETMRLEEVTLAQTLKTAGYRTALFGKWHLGEHYPYVPHARGFDEFTGMRTGHWMAYWDSPLERNGKPWQAKGYIADVLTDEAIRFAGENRDRPFFLYLAYNTPHSPFQAPQDLFDRHKQAGLSDEVASVYAMVENLDSNIGRLLKHIDKLGLARDTIVLFLCDNGANGERFNAGLRARKGAVYEGGIRSPLFVRWTGRIASGRKIDKLSAHIDVLPTVLELSGVQRVPGPPLDGMSLVPLLDGKPWRGEDRMFFTHRDRGPVPQASDGGAVRTQRFNLINGRELYDISKDPGESRNIAAEHPEVVKSFHTAYERWFAGVTRGQTYARLPIPVGYAEENPAKLMAPQAHFAGNVRFFGKQGWAHDWLTNFAEPGDAGWWDIDAAAAGAYELTVLYGSANGAVKVRVQAGGKQSEAELPQAAAEPIDRRDLVPRKETVDMRWHTATLGRFDLPKGKATARIEVLSSAPDLYIKELWVKRL